MKSQRFLVNVEYISLGGSVLGTILTGITGQAAWAATPLTLALSLNSLNRKELARCNRQMGNDVILLDKRLDNVADTQRQNSDHVSLKEKEQTDRLEETSLLKQDIDLLQASLSAIEKELVNVERKSPNSDYLKKGELESLIIGNNRSWEIIDNRITNIVNQFASKQDLDEALNRLVIAKQNSSQPNIEEMIESLSNTLQNTRPEYQLVIDRQGSRRLLLQALSTAQKHLILVCPWIMQHGTDPDVFKAINSFVIDRGGELDIGWGHLSDLGTRGRIPDRLVQVEEFILSQSKGNFNFYDRVQNLLKLSEKYPNQVRLKFIGTHEKFLVCDRIWAMLGSHNFLTSTDKSKERELGIKTNDLNIVGSLIKRFNDAPCLDELRSSYVATQRSIISPVNRIQNSNQCLPRPILKNNL